ncbi:MAG TPA: hypothetical protein VFH90_05245, partial [Candidatus Limnocylindria bacterium]|nr:hypothetical protein [Candidatus Limnocylindria bacterium]
MSPPRVSTVVIGEVVVSAVPAGLERAEAIGIDGGRVMAAGSRAEVMEMAAPGARILDVRPRAVVPGLRDFHLHLVGMARARREVVLDAVSDFDGALASVA